MATTSIVSSLQGLEAIGGLNCADIASVTKVSEATVSCWQNGTKKPLPKDERVPLDLAQVVWRLESYFDINEARLWLYRSHPQLEGQRAIDLIRDGRIVETLQVLDRLDSDGFIQPRSLKLGRHPGQAAKPRRSGAVRGTQSMSTSLMSTRPKSVAFPSAGLAALSP